LRSVWSTKECRKNGISDLNKQFHSTHAVFLRFCIFRSVLSVCSHCMFLSKVLQLCSLHHKMKTAKTKKLQHAKTLKTQRKQNKMSKPKLVSVSLHSFLSCVCHFVSRNFLIRRTTDNCRLLKCTW